MAVSLHKPGFALSEVVDILMEMFHVDDTRRETFISRIQQLQKLGLPADVNLGRGTKVRYLNWQLADLAIHLELLNCGITPGLLKDYFRPFGRNYIGIYSMGGSGWLIQKSLADAEADLFHLLRFNALTYLTKPKSSDEEDRAHPLDRHDFGRSSKNVVEELSKAPALTINLTDHLRRLTEAVKKAYPSRMEDITFYPTRSGLREDT